MSIYLLHEFELFNKIKEGRNFYILLHNLLHVSQMYLIIIIIIIINIIIIIIIIIINISYEEIKMKLISKFFF